MALTYLSLEVYLILKKIFFSNVATLLKEKFLNFFFVIHIVIVTEVF